MQLTAALLVMATVTLPLLLLLLSWQAWVKHDKTTVNRYRRTLFGVGVLATAISLLLFAGFAFFAPKQLFWSGDGFWASFVGVVLCLLGKGKSRVLGILSAALIWAVWLVLAWSPP